MPTSAFDVMIRARAVAVALQPARSLSLFAAAASALSPRGKKTGPVAKPSPALCRAVVENGEIGFFYIITLLRP